MPESSTGRKVSECGGSWGGRRRRVSTPSLFCRRRVPGTPCPEAHGSGGDFSPPGGVGSRSGSQEGAGGSAPGRRGTPFASCRRGPALSAGTLRNREGEDWIALPLGFVKSSGGSCGGGGDSLCPLRTSLSPSLCQLVGPAAAGAGASAARRPPPQSACRVTPATFATLLSLGDCEREGVAGPRPQDGGGAVPGPQPRELAVPGAVAVGAQRSRGAAARPGAALLQKSL